MDQKPMTFSFWPLRSKVVLALKIALNVALGAYILSADRFSSDPRYAVVTVACAFFLHAFAHLMSDLLTKKGQIELTNDRIRFQRPLKPGVDQPLAQIVRLVIPPSFLGFPSSKRTILFANGHTIEFDSGLGGYRKLIRALEQKTGMAFAAEPSPEVSPA